MIEPDRFTPAGLRAPSQSRSFRVAILDTRAGAEVLDASGTDLDDLLVFLSAERVIASGGTLAIWTYDSDTLTAFTTLPEARLPVHAPSTLL